MKRIAAIVGLLVCAALGVAAFVFAGNDSGGKHKSSATIIQEPPKLTTTTHKGTTSSDAPETTQKVASESPTPTPPSSDDNQLIFHPDDHPELDGYEARRTFVGVDPRVVRVGRQFEVQVRGFPTNIDVTIKVYNLGGTAETATLHTDNKGRARAKLPAPPAGAYSVEARATLAGFPTVTTGLKSVLKKD